MTHPIRAAITVGEPNWAPLELVLPACELENFMYMGRAGEIELYKHWLTRRYLNISADGQRFYRYSDGTYVEVSQSCGSRPCTQPRPLGKEQPPWQRASTGHFCSGTLARIPRSELHRAARSPSTFLCDYRPGEGPSGQLVRQDRVAQPGRLRPDRGDRARLCEQGHATLHPGQDPDALLG
jgi:hypothetical protein